MDEPTPAAASSGGEACPARPRASLVNVELEGSGAGDGLWFVVVDGYYSDDDGQFTLTISN